MSTEKLLSPGTRVAIYLYQGVILEHTFIDQYRDRWTGELHTRRMPYPMYLVEVDTSTRAKPPGKNYPVPNDIQAARTTWKHWFWPDELTLITSP